MFLFAIIFSLLAAIGEVDMIVPSFPEMQDRFGVSAFVVELALALNLISHIVAALFAANIGDRIGRKKAILYGFVLFIAGSLLGALANSFPLVLLGRVMQGAGVAPAIVLSYLIAMDRYPANEQGRIMGLLNGTVALSLSAAPVLGSFITLHFGYQGNFWLMSVSGILAMLVIALFVPNDQPRNVNASFSLSHYVPVLKHSKAMLYIIMVSLMIATYYTFVGTASLLFVDALQLSLADFGLYMGAATFTYGILSILSGRLMKLIGKANVFKMSMVLLVLFMVASATLIFNNITNPLYILLVSLLFVLGMVVPVNEGFVMGLESMPGGQARASALIGTFKWVFTVIGVQTASWFFQENYLPIGITLIVMMGSSLVLMLYAYNRDPAFQKLIRSQPADGGAASH